jgi:phosphopantothenoylcysteine decarboxylase / phosphopantothenate---cysteine ligase
MPNPLQDKRIILGVTGSIACYKAADLASKLTQAGAQLDVIFTQGAAQFITPLTFQSVTGRRAFTEGDLWGSEAHVLHVGLGHSADLLLIAPATANTIAKLANGLADNLLTVTALAAECPIVMAPAMDAGMYSHPATLQNVMTLRQRGVIFLGPAEGRMASGLLGVGRMLEPQEIMTELRWIFARGGPLSGKKVVVTAGGTQEPIDPVRVIANRSSGKQGFEIAQAALDLGAQVTLIAGPTPLSALAGVKRKDVRTAQGMLDAVLQEVGDAHILVMAAAVADFRPTQESGQKIKKGSGPPDIRLEHTPDILAEVARLKEKQACPQVVIGFAAESQDLIANARAKLEQKKLDLIVANDISAPDAGFSVDTNRVALLDASGGVENLPLMSKSQVAEIVMAKAVALLADRDTGESC